MLRWNSSACGAGRVVRDNYLSGMNWILVIFLGLVVSVACIAIYVRVAPHDLEMVHVDPLTSGDTSPRSAHIAPPDAPTYAAEPDAVFAALGDLIMGEFGAELLAIDNEARHASYVVRSRFWRFPDYVSFRVVPHEGGASIAIYARSRFGGYDHGVNRDRLERWFASLSARLGAS